MRKLQSDLGCPYQIKKPEAFYTPNSLSVYMEISINEKIEGEFRERAMQTYGYRKGAFKEALEEAIADWLKKIASQSKKEKGND